ncbi:MAG: rhomboid family intramembrane serine protease [Planctomycetota bacterium]|jgi:membrane associated rhomboid family serine protease
MNYALIGVNLLCFMLSYWPHRDPFTGAPEILQPWAQHLMLFPVMPHVWQFLTYAFLHGSLMHILGNMYFLYLFGNNVNDKLGHIGYLCLYLGGAVFAGVGHALLHSSPVLGASGAVAAITGAYLVLFPQTLITILYWFFFIGTMELSALYFIILKLIVWDNIFVPQFSQGAIAFDAHLAGYLSGIAAMAILLATGLIERTGFDLWSMVRQWNRRRVYRDSVSDGYDPYYGRPGAKLIKAKQRSSVDSKTQDKIMELRGGISSRIGERNLHSAAELYLELAELDKSQVLPSQQLLDIANQLASESRYSDASVAYESFLDQYSNYEYVEQVQLMLGLVYARYLDNSELAKKYLELAMKKLSDPGQLAMCKDELGKLAT